MNTSAHSISGYPPSTGSVTYQAVTPDDLTLLIKAFHEGLPWPVDGFLGHISNVSIRRQGYTHSTDKPVEVVINLVELRGA